MEFLDTIYGVAYHLFIVTPFSWKIFLYIKFKEKQCCNLQMCTPTLSDMAACQSQTAAQI